MLEAINRWFWNPDIWLPPNVTWTDLVPNKTIQYTDHRDLIYPIPLALLLLVLRYLLERYCYAPFGQLLGVRPHRIRPVPPQPELEQIFRRNAKPGQKEIEEGAALLSKSEREVARWFRLRRMKGKPSKLTKFCENTFRFNYYLFSFCFGISVLWNKEWLWDIQACWYSYPHQSVDQGVWWYYIMNLTFYWSLTMSQFFDVKHKDFWQMFVHHLATISLMSFSWVCNMTRIGSLVLVVHDFADILLDASKMAMYTKYQRVCDAFFVTFTISWIATRLGVYPFWIMRNTLIEAAYIVPMFPAYYIFNFLLSLLLVLHFFWTYLILRVAYNSILVGKMDGDIRSSSEEEEEEDSNDSPSPSVQENGVKKDK